ncbi:MAG: CheR family methyltransferase [Planctomycetia bacterium]
MQPPLLHPEALRSAEAFLRRTIGLDPETIGQAAIGRAVRQRMEACADRDIWSFLDRLARDDDEQSRFIDDVVVPESWFFRDPQVFGFLRRFAVTFATAPGQTPLRILCVPCAAGEEPYSAAMTLLEAGLAAHQFRIDAADVSRAALARAEAATYSANAFRAEDLSFRDRWFHVQHATARLADEVRQQVHFLRGNLLDDSFVADREPYDVIFCRNLLIYLTGEARSRVERTIDRLLGPDGLLILGAAEPPIMKAPWIPAAGNSVFTLRRGPRPAAPAAIPMLARQPPVDARPPAPALPDGTAAEPVGPNDRTRPPPADELIREAEALANDGRHAEALALCRRYELSMAPCPRMFFLMGMLHQAVGDLERAEGCLHTTLYLDANHDEALLALAVVATRRGDGRMAETYRRTAARVLERKGAS